MPEQHERDRPEAGPVPHAVREQDPSEPLDLPDDELEEAPDEGPGSQPRRQARAAQRDAGPGGSLRDLTESGVEDAGPGTRPPRARAH